MKPTYRFLSWGGGIQSTWLLVLAGLGEIPPIDAAIVADTQWERRETRRIYHYYSQWAAAHGIKVEVVTAGNIRLLGAEGHIHIPFWTETGGPLKRQCTKNFKISPIKKAMRRMAGYHESKPPHPAPGGIENLIGISWDEWERMSTSRVKYIVHSYPLVEKKLARWDCVDGFNRLRLPVPTKSACIGCPYRSASSWLEMKENSPDEFEEACAFDDANRHNPLATRTGSTADRIYLWRGGVPLRSADLIKEAKKERKARQIPMMACTGELCWT